MSTLAANNITDAAGTGGPTLANGLTIGTSPLTAPSGSAPSYTCRAWVNFDGTTNVGGFCTIRESGNVSSVADNGTGDYTVNFTTAMPDANYSVVGAVQNTTYPVRNNSLQPTTYSTSSISVNCITANASYGALYDQNYVNIAVFR